MEGVWLASYSILWLVVLAEAFLILAMFRQLGRLYLGNPVARMMQGLSVGSEAPDFSLPDLGGRTLELSAHRGRMTLLIFGSTSCVPCRDLFPGLNEFYRSRPPSLEIVFLSAGSLADNQGFVERNGVQVPLVPLTDGEVAEKYEVQVTPYAFLVDEDGVIAAKGGASRVELLRELLEEVDGKPIQERRIERERTKGTLTA